MTGPMREDEEVRPAAGQGTWDSPLILNGPIPSEYPARFADRPYIIVVPKGGARTKWYRSYGDYCD